MQDGSIFLNIVKLRAMLGDAFKLEIDVNDDVFEMGAMQHHCFGTLKKKMAIWILGGGVPKNYTLQGEPLLDQILGVPTHGFDIDVQFCVDPVDNGALAQLPRGRRAHLGQSLAESVQSRHVYVHCDVTAVFPWLTYALLSDARVHKKPRRLYDAARRAVRNLQREIDEAKEEAARDGEVRPPEEAEEPRRRRTKRPDDEAMTSPTARLRRLSTSSDCRARIAARTTRSTPCSTSSTRPRVEPASAGGRRSPACPYV